MHPVRSVLLTGLIFALVVPAPAMAQTPRIDFDDERAEFSARGYTITEGEDEEGNTWWTYRPESSQPPTRVTFRDCNANGCTTAIFRQEKNGVCLSKRCRDAREAFGTPQFRRLTEVDIEGWIAGSEPATLRLEDGEDYQMVVFERVWIADGSRSLAQAAFDIDGDAYQVWRKFTELWRDEAGGS